MEKWIAQVTFRISAIAIMMQALLTGMRAATYSDFSARIYAFLQLVIYAVLFQSLNNIHGKLHNPFLAGRLGVAHEAIARGGLQRLADGLLGGIDFAPPIPSDAPQLPDRGVAPAPAEPNGAAEGRQQVLNGSAPSPAKPSDMKLDTSSASDPRRTLFRTFRQPFEA